MNYNVCHVLRAYQKRLAKVRAGTYHKYSITPKNVLSLYFSIHRSKTICLDYGLNHTHVATFQSNGAKGSHFSTFHFKLVEKFNTFKCSFMVLE